MWEFVGNMMGSCIDDMDLFMNGIETTEVEKISSLTAKPQRPCQLTCVSEPTGCLAGIHLSTARAYGE
jgi:hypothetical protein